MINSPRQKIFHISIVSFLFLASLCTGSVLAKATKDEFSEAPEDQSNQSRYQGSAQYRQNWERGLTAVEKKQWDLAIEYFNAAKKELRTFYNKKHPELIFNLALSYDRRGGAPLVAAAWFKAFLALEPEAANAGFVRKRIDQLVVQFEGTAWKIIREAEEFAPKGSPESDFLGRRTVLWDAMGKIAGAYAYMGRIDYALRLPGKARMERGTANRWIAHKYLMHVFENLGESNALLRAYDQYEKGIKSEIAETREMVSARAKKEFQSREESLLSSDDYSTWVNFVSKPAFPLHLPVAGPTEDEFGHPALRLMFEDFPSFRERIRNKSAEELVAILADAALFMSAAVYNFKRIERISNQRSK